MFATIHTTTTRFETVDGYSEDVYSDTVSETTEYESITELLDDLDGHGVSSFYAVEASQDPMPLAPGEGVWLSDEAYAHPYLETEERKTLHITGVSDVVRGYIFRVLLGTEIRYTRWDWAVETAYGAELEADAERDGLYAGYSEGEINEIACERVTAFLTACEAEGISPWPAGEAPSAHASAEIGHDLYMTQHGEGCGFWDGDYAERGDDLTRIAKACGEFC